jgi:hypothetical protein
VVSPSRATSTPDVPGKPGRFVRSAGPFPASVVARAQPSAGGAVAASGHYGRWLRAGRPDIEVFVAYPGPGVTGRSHPPADRPAIATLDPARGLIEGQHPRRRGQHLAAELRPDRGHQLAQQTRRPQLPQRPLTTRSQTHRAGQKPRGLQRLPGVLGRSPARWDLCGGPPVRAVPTATLNVFAAVEGGPAGRRRTRWPSATSAVARSTQRESLRSGDIRCRSAAEPVFRFTVGGCDVHWPCWH